MADPYLEQLRWSMKEIAHEIQRKEHENRMKLIEGESMARGFVQTPISLEPNNKRRFTSSPIPSQLTTPAVKPDIAAPKDEYEDEDEPFGAFAQESAPKRLKMSSHTDESGDSTINMGSPAGGEWSRRVAKDQGYGGQGLGREQDRQHQAWNQKINTDFIVKLLPVFIDSLQMIQVKHPEAEPLAEDFAKFLNVSRSKEESTQIELELTIIYLLEFTRGSGLPRSPCEKVLRLLDKVSRDSRECARQCEKECDHQKRMLMIDIKIEQFQKEIDFRMSQVIGC